MRDFRRRMSRKQNWFLLIQVWPASKTVSQTKRDGLKLHNRHGIWHTLYMNTSFGFRISPQNIALFMFFFFFHKAIYSQEEFFIFLFFHMLTLLQPIYTFLPMFSSSSELHFTPKKNFLHAQCPCVCEKFHVCFIILWRIKKILPHRENCVIHTIVSMQLVFICPPPY